MFHIYYIILLIFVEKCFIFLIKQRGHVVKITELTEIELIYLAEDLICILDCKARNDDEYATPDDLVEENLRKTPIVLDLIGWHEEAKTLRNITLKNIT